MASELEFETASSVRRRRNFDLLLDIPLEVTVELGRTRLALRDLLGLAAGSVVELGKLAGEPARRPRERQARRARRVRDA